MDCVKCAKLVAVEYELNGSNGGRYRRQMWTCPHCQHENALNLAGQIVGAAKV